MCAGVECHQVQAGSDVSVSGRGGFRSGLHLWAIGITLIVVILIGCGTTIWDLHRQTIEQHLVAVSNLGVVLGEQTERYVDLVDRTLEDIQSRVAELGITSPDELTLSFRTEAMDSFLRERLVNLPRNNAFTVLNADGRVLDQHAGAAGYGFIGSRLFPPFRHARRSGAVHQRAGQEPCDRYTDRLRLAPNQRPGSHLPWSCGSSDRPGYLTDFYRAIELPPGETVTLLRSDGLVLVRYPDPSNQVGKWMPAVSPWYQLVAGQGGTYRSPGFLAPQSAVVSVHKLRAWPLVIDVSMMEQVALEKWRQQASVIALGGLGAALGFAVLFTVIGPAVPPPGGAECDTHGDGGSLARERGPDSGLRRNVVRLVLGTGREFTLHLDLRRFVVGVSAWSGISRKDPMGAGQRRPEHAILA